MNYTTVGDCCDILDSQRVPVTKSDRKKGIYPYYGANGVQDYVDDFLFDDELVLVAEDGGHFGSKEHPIAYRVSGKCWVNNHAHVLKPREGIDIDYLCYSLMYYPVQSLIKGATRKKLNQSDLRKMKIVLRPLDQQKRIVALIKEVEDGSKLCRELVVKLDTLVKSRFIEMFGDLRTNSYKWDIQTFEKLTDLITDGEHATPRRAKQGIYLLSARNILNHSLQLDDVDYIDEEEYNRIARRITPRKGDVLISCSGSVGRCCSVPAGLKFQMVRSAALLRFKPSINPVFAEYLITSDYLQGQINSSKTASSQANLFQGKIAKLKGIAPPLNLQKQFAAFVEQVDKSKAVLHKLLKKQELLRAALMQEYFG